MFKLKRQSKLRGQKFTW